MTNFIRKVSVAVKGGPGGAGFFVFQKKKVPGGGRLYIDRKIGVLEPIATDRVNVLGTAIVAVTLDGSDDGVTVVAMNAAATVTVTLPKAATVGAGATFRVLAGALPGAGAGLTVTPNAVDKFQGNGFGAKTAGQTLINSAASDVVGDMVELVTDGVLTWFVTNKIGTWA